MMSMKQLKEVEQDTQHLVFGFMRQQEKQYALFNNITPGICILCIAYYYIPEYFAKAGDDVTISEDKKTITKTSEVNPGWWNTTYGAVWIDSMVHQIVTWKFLIKRLKTGYDIFFCLVSTDDQVHADCGINDEKYPNYGFGDDLSSTVNGKGVICEHAEEDSHFKQDDIVIMKLNTKKQELYAQDENETNLLVFKGVIVRTGLLYKMAISFHTKLNSVTLIDFDRKFLD